MPRSCLVNNCLIFSLPLPLPSPPPLTPHVPLVSSYVRSFTRFGSLLAGRHGGGGRRRRVYERLKNRSNCAHMPRFAQKRKSGRNYCRNRRNEWHARVMTPASWKRSRERTILSRSRGCNRRRFSPMTNDGVEKQRVLLSLTDLSKSLFVCFFFVGTKRDPTQLKKLFSY